MISMNDRSRLTREITLVLVLTFGMSGVRSALRLISALIDPRPLSDQTTTLNSSQAVVPWIDALLQLCSAAVLFGWGMLALFLLANVSYKGQPTPLPHLHGLIDARNWAHGAGLAALIGLPGLAFYVTAVKLGLSKEVIPTGLDARWWEDGALLVWSAANAFGEEIVVVLWLMTRLTQLGWSLPVIIAASSILRGSYHLYQGISAGLGNIIMGVVFSYYFYKTGRVWPLVIAHFLIDAVAFVGYSALGGNLSWLGL